jgi:hypothetical protein
MTPNEEAVFENWFGDIIDRLIYREDPILRTRYSIWIMI